MRVGICTSPEFLKDAADAGFAYAEMGCSTLLYDQDDAAFAPVRKQFLDAPITIEGEPGWLLNHIGNRFSLLLTHGPETDLMLEKLKDHHDLQLITVSFDHDGPLPSTKVEDTAGLIGESYQLQDGTCYLIRPDQHVCARWRKPDGNKVLAAIDRALGKSLDGTESR